MGKSYKLKDNNYWDSTGIVHNKEKLSDILTYSTVEKKVGTWVDGKPLYRKVVSGVLNETTTGTNTNTNISTGIVNCDNLFVKNAYFISNSRNIPIPYFTNDGFSVRIIPVANGTTVTVINNYANYSGSTVVMILEYTKTTD